ncbi:unnamed protein product [Agarophyton chilense]|eukprot:gb/GEZJ01000833.1/.p1 GENE.gb/GEZJ01000833.1/~~gb/GEZJ01000833.1/.p1  ORF type:complete len:708 (-),score=102.41 gb/GEZJ01000833.1/:2308-4431(-)
MPGVGPEEVMPINSIEDDFQRKRDEMHRVAKDCVVIVDNVPKIGPEKYEKLVGRLTPLFERPARMRQDEHDKPRLNFARNESGSTLGFAIAEYMTPEDAHKAVTSLHNFQLDRSHRFWVCTAGNLEKLRNIPERFVPPPPLPPSLKNRPNFKSWLLDERGRDQFMIRHNHETSVYWHDHIVKPQLDYAKVMWSDAGVVWSPRGTYLATFHQRGIKLWGRTTSLEGEVDWVIVMRFEHSNVSLVHFSPCEKYLITFNGTEPERDDKRNPRAILIWDVLTGKKKRGFLGPPRSMIGPDGTIPWPIFQWSHDDKYFARLNENAISVYQTLDMGVVDKKSMKIPHVRGFAWSPTSNIMAYWTPEVNDSPARVTVVELPSKKEIRQKALYSVSSIVLHWQQEGKFLCCKVDRLTKSKKGQFTNFELFRVQAKDIPIEVLEYKEKDIVQAFGWEPQGHRFAVIHGYSDKPGKTDVSFFTMEGIIGELKPLFTLENRNVNQMRWSPKGRFVLLAALGSPNGNLEWYDINDAIGKETPEPVGTNQHFLCNDAQWDPSGRFVSSFVTYWRNSNENGFVIWTMYGKELCRTSVEMLYQFAWRPRPPSLLSAKQRKAIKKSLKVKKEKYEREDKDLRDTVSSGKAAQRKAQRDAFYAFRNSAKKTLDEEATRRQEAIAVYGTSGDDKETITEVVETIVSVKNEIDFSKKLLTSDDERD